MSRTYKDRPARVRSADRRLKNQFVYHGCAEHSKHYRYYIEECDVDAISPPMDWRHHCYRSTNNSHDYLFKDDRQLQHGQHRAEERVILGKLVVEYNSNYEVEDDYVFTPHVKNAMFGGGYIN